MASEPYDDAFARRHGYFIRGHQVVFTKVDDDGMVVTRGTAQPASHREIELYQLLRKEATKHVPTRTGNQHPA